MISRRTHMRTTPKLTIFIDESGTLPDPTDKFIVICGVGVRQTKEAKNIISRILSSLRQRKIRINEVKFYRAGQNTKRQFLSGIVSASFDIFVLVVNKKGRKIADSPENFALLVADLVNEIKLWYKPEKVALVIDRHFHRKNDQSEFDKFLSRGINGNLKHQIAHVDSQHIPSVNTADMAAGAVLWKYTEKDPQFYHLIKDNIVVEKIISWPEIKRKNISQLKNLT